MVFCGGVGDWAMANELKAIASQGFHSIIVEFDSLTAIRLLRVEEVNLTTVRSLVEEILEVSVVVKVRQFRHIECSRNYGGRMFFLFDIRGCPGQLIHRLNS